MGSMNRRAFVASGLAGVAAGPTALAAPPRRRDRTAARPAPPLARGGSFPQGVMAGQPAQRAVTLWAQHAGAERPGPLRLEVAADPEFRRVVHRELVSGDAETAIARRRVRSRRLRAGRPYWYRFATADGSSPVGRFSTLRPPDSREPTRIGVFSCQMFFLGYFTGHAALAREDLDLVVCLGDYIYETYLDLTRAEPRPEGASGGAETLAEYRAKYAAYRSDADLRAMHAAHAFLPVWDDHEVANDYAGDDVPDRRARARSRAAAAQRLPRVVRGDAGRAPAPPAGPDPPAAAARAAISTSSRSTPASTACPDRTMLGADQEDWLVEGLARSQATWKLLGSSVLMMDLNGPGSEDITGASAGSWQAFPTAVARSARPSWAEACATSPR
jgi:alkaline phosphatase D